LVVHVKGICDSGDRVNQYFPHADTFISSISHEERYIRGLQLLSEKAVRVQNKVVFYFNQVLNNYNRVDEEANFDRAFGIAGADKKLYVDMYNEIDGLLEFKDYLEQNLNLFENKNIIVD
jgi:hypothetical protein